MPDVKCGNSQIVLPVWLLCSLVEDEHSLTHCFPTQPLSGSNACNPPYLPCFCLPRCRLLALSCATIQVLLGVHMHRSRTCSCCLSHLLRVPLLPKCHMEQNLGSTLHRHWGIIQSSHLDHQPNMLNLSYLGAMLASHGGQSSSHLTTFR